MNTTDEHMDSLAALYALGALDESQRKEAVERYASDPNWQPLLNEWLLRLDPLTQLTDPIVPPRSVWESIEKRISTESLASRGADVTGDTVAGDPDQSSSRREGQSSRGLPAQLPGRRPDFMEETIELWRQRVRYWQTATWVSVVAMACVAAILVLKPMPFQSVDTVPLPATVAVLMNEQNVPLWAVSLRSAAATGQAGSGQFGELLVTVIGQPQLEETQSHQMWMVLKDGQGVQSVGLLPEGTGDVRRLILPRPLADAAELAVSLEPKGGVPGPEHGPVVTRTPVVTPGVRESI